MTALKQHMNGLDDEPIWVILECDDAIHPHDVDPQLLRDVLNPGKELCRVERAIAHERKAGHLIVVFVRVIAIEKIGLRVQDAVEAECVAMQNLIQRNSASLGLVYDRGRIHRSDSPLHRQQLLGADEIGLIEEDNVRERDLFLRLGALSS